MFSWFTKSLGGARIKPTWESLEREGVNANKELLKKCSSGVLPLLWSKGLAESVKLKSCGMTWMKPHALALWQVWMHYGLHLLKCEKPQKWKPGHLHTECRFHCLSESRSCFPSILVRISPANCLYALHYVGFG